jgi:peroxiredoxin
MRLEKRMPLKIGDSAPDFELPAVEGALPVKILRDGPPLAGISERALFIVDKTGKIVFAKVYPLDQMPKNEELLEAIKKTPE